MQWPPTKDAFRAVEDTLAWVLEHSAYYQRVFREGGIRLHEIEDYETFRARVPLLRKSELAANQRAHPPFGEFVTVPRSQFGSLHTSPGPIFLPRLAEEVQGTEVLRDAIRGMGVGAGDVAHVTLSYHIMPGGLRLHRAFEAAGCLVINGGTGASELQVQLAWAWQATVYAGTPSFLARLGDAARQIGINPREDLAYRVGFSTAEALTASLRRELEETFGIELFDHCGEAQIGPLAGECRMHQGMHLHARDLFLEFLHPETGEPVQPGEVGELVATQLGPRALPLVRYAPGDAFRLMAEPCPCGDPTPRVQFVGQVGAIRKIKGVLVHPAQVAQVLQAFPEAKGFQVLIERPPGARYDRAVLRLGVEAAGDSSSLVAQVAEAIKAQILIQMEVELVRPDTLPPDAGLPPYRNTMVDLRQHDASN